MRRFCPILTFLVPILVAALHVHAQEQKSAAAEDGLPFALRLTVTEHPSVKTKVSELKSLGYDVESAEARRYPVFSLLTQAMSDEQNQVTARVQQPLWVGGRIDGNIAQTEVRLKSGRISMLLLRRQLLEQTASTYAILQGARRRLEASQRNVAEHERLQALISRRQVGSIASEADVRLASARLAQAVAQRDQLQAQVLKAQNDLASLTQVPLEGVVPVDERLISTTDGETIISILEKQSPGVLLKQSEVELARVNVRLADSEMMPSLYARFESDIYSANRNGTLPSGTRIGAVLEGSVEGLGIVAWKRRSSADAKVRAAEQDVETARNEVRRIARALLADRDMLQRVRKSNELLVRANQETLESFMRQYDAGRKTWIDVLNTQREVSDSWQALEQTNASLLETGLRLSAMLGQLDGEAGVQP